MPVLSANNVSVSLSGKRILKDLNFEISGGSWTGILGPNGSGKTTLLRAVSGLLEYEGDLRLLDQAVSSWSSREMARHLAFVRQTHSMSFDFKVSELVLLGRSPHKSVLSSYNDQDDAHVKTALESVDLNGFTDRLFHSLSGGEQQRVFLAQALAQEADVLILDEPTTYLDVHHQYEFMQHVRGLVDMGKSVIGAFHDLELAARFSDELLILKEGRVAASGTPVDVLNEDLLAEVFRMRASVESANSDAVRIAYNQPL